MKKILYLLGIICLFSSGCSVVMAVKQPEEKNLQVLSPGTYRDAVRAELGAPISTGLTENSEEYDVFGFQEGNSKGWGVARAFLYGILDTFTLGAWEIIGTPIEGGISGGGRKNIRVVYKEKMVMRVEDLTPQPPPKTQ